MMAFTTKNGLSFVEKAPPGRGCEGRNEVVFDLATFRTNAKRLKGVTEGLALLRSKVW